MVILEIDKLLSAVKVFGRKKFLRCTKFLGGSKFLRGITYPKITTSRTQKKRELPAKVQDQG